MWGQGLHHHVVIGKSNLFTMTDFCCKVILKKTEPQISLADKNVLIFAVFTKCWPRPRPKVRLLNHDGLLTLNCRHHLKISEPQSEERRSSGQTEDNRRCRRGLKTQKEHCGTEASWWSCISTSTPSHAAPSSCLPKRSGFLLSLSWWSLLQVRQTHTGTRYF